MQKITAQMAAARAPMTARVAGVTSNGSTVVAGTSVRLTSVNLFASEWVGDASPYSQVVELTGITPYSKVDLQPSVEQLDIFHEKDIAFSTENEDGVVTVYVVGDKPANDYTIQATVMEVEM